MSKADMLYNITTNFNKCSVRQLCNWIVWNVTVDTSLKDIRDCSASMGEVTLFDFSGHCQLFQRVYELRLSKHVLIVHLFVSHKTFKTWYQFANTNHG